MWAPNVVLKIIFVTNFVTRIKKCRIYAVYGIINAGSSPVTRMNALNRQFEGLSMKVERPFSVKITKKE